MMLLQANTVAQPELRVIDLMIKGGWVMIPILLLSLIGTYVFIERFIVIKRSLSSKSDILRQVKHCINEGRLDIALSICQSSNTLVAKMLLKGLNKLGQPIKDIEQAMENVGKIEISKLEKNMGILGIVAAIAPMFGFLGTISGVIRIFFKISLENNINIGTISGGLYEKMITSAAGLLIGIMAYVGYHIISMMIDKVTLSAEIEASDFLEMLEDTSK